MKSLHPDTPLPTVAYCSANCWDGVRRRRGICRQGELSASADSIRRSRSWAIGGGSGWGIIAGLIHEVDPEVVEEWKYHGEPGVVARRERLAVGNAYQNKVKVTFANGAQLRDPGKVFNAGLGGKKWRAIDIFEGDRIDR